MNSARDPLVTQKRASPKKEKKHRSRVDKLNPNAYLGFVWIPLILLKIENTVTILKCVNSTVIPIFNEKVAEKK